MFDARKKKKNVDYGSGKRPCGYEDPFGGPCILVGPHEAHVDDRKRKHR